MGTQQSCANNLHDKPGVLSDKGKREKKSDARQKSEKAPKSKGDASKFRRDPYQCTIPPPPIFIIGGAFFIRRFGGRECNHGVFEAAPRRQNKPDQRPGSGLVPFYGCSGTSTTVSSWLLGDQVSHQRSPTGAGGRSVITCISSCVRLHFAS